MTSQTRNSRPAPRNATGADRNDNVAALAHERYYAPEDLERLATEAGKVLGTPDEDVGVFASNPHRTLAAVRTALCLLGRRAVRAIENGTGPGSAWAPFDDLAHLARTLGKPAEREQPESRREDRRQAAPKPTLVDAKGGAELVALSGKLQTAA
jgi:hypothetical protein